MNYRNAIIESTINGRGTAIKSIGNIIKDKWFNPKELAEELKK